MTYPRWMMLLPLALTLIACNSAAPEDAHAGMPGMTEVETLGVSAISLPVGQTRSLLPELSGPLATATDRVWSTDTGGVASVNQDGLVQAWHPGTATIRAALRSNPATVLAFTVTVVAAGTPVPVSAPISSAPAATGLPALLKDYRSMTTVQVQGKDFAQADYSEMVYRPRQFASGLRVDLHNVGAAAASVADPGKFAGWDTLVTPNDPANSVGRQDDWLVLHLNRAATLGLIWRSQYPRPAWMQDWSAQGSVKLNVTAGAVQTAPVYTKSFAAGEVRLGRVEAPAPAGSHVYVVLLAEASGAPSSAPATPAGQPVPTPNAACPAWVHDQYLATGPDGKSYPTWHPQIDPRYWCSFGHEHGSDPAALGGSFRPLYGYTASVDGMAEPHVGFKTYTFRNPASGRVWVMTQHFGTAGAGRVCTRHHTLDVAVLDGGTLKADLHLMGDFGRAQVFTAGGIKTVTGCPLDQSTVPDRGVRVINTSQDGGYEPWVVDNENNVTGFFPGFMSFKTRDFIARCADQACKTVIARPGQYGAGRILDYQDLWVKAGSPGRNSGKFWTTPLADKFVAAGTPGAVRQYLAPGFQDVMARPADPGGFCGAFDTWQNVYECDKPIITPMTNLEGGLTQNN